MRTSNRTNIWEITKRGDLACIQKIFNKNPELIDATDIAFFKQTPLHIAAQQGFYSVVEFLVNCGADVNVRDSFEQTSLHCAASKGNTKVVEFLLNSGAQVNVCDDKKYTPLHFASNNKHVKVVELLLSRGAQSD